MEKMPLIAVLTDYDETYEVRNADGNLNENGEDGNERLFISIGDGDEHIS